MTVLRAPIPLLNVVLTQMIGTSLGAGGPGYIVPVAPPSQLGASGGSNAGIQLSPSTVFNPSSQKIALQFGADAILVITAPLLRTLVTQSLASFDVGRLPSEALSLSQECCANFQGSWPAVFQQIGFTAFTLTVGYVPSLNC